MTSAISIPAPPIPVNANPPHVIPSAAEESKTSIAPTKPAHPEPPATPLRRHSREGGNLNPIAPANPVTPPPVIPVLDTGTQKIPSPSMREGEGGGDTPPSF